MKRAVAILLAMIMLLGMLTGCREASGPAASSDPGNTSEPGGEVKQEVSQGVLDDEILIGTIALTSGAYAFVGTPAITGIQSVFDRFNAQGGVRGRTLTLISYDDQGDPATGQTFVEKMVEEDKVFLLMNLGSEVEAMIPYFQDVGIPCVNIGCTDDSVYQESAPGSRIFQVMPAFTTDGRYLAARVLHEPLFGPNGDQKLPDDAKIGVAYATDTYSATTLNGLLEQARLEGAEDRFVCEVVAAGTQQAAIQKFKDEGCQAVILIPYAGEWWISAMDDAQWEVPFFGSYGLSTIANYAPDTYKPTRPIYANIWSDFTTEKGKGILDDLYDALGYNDDIPDEATRQSYLNNNYCVAGYAYACFVVEALSRFNDHPEMEINWENLVTLIESEPFYWGDVEYSYANGRRMGIETQAIFEYVGDPANGTETFYIIEGFDSIEDIMAK